MIEERHSMSRGFTLIELLIVVAIIGIIAAIAIPNLMNAMHVAKQKRSLGDLRTITTALSVYRIDHSRYPLLGDTTTLELVPYLGELPDYDGWGSPFAYKCAGNGSRYTAISFGSNRVPDTPYSTGPIRRHLDDIVYTDGNLLQWPDGTQRDE